MFPKWIGVHFARDATGARQPRSGDEPRQIGRRSGARREPAGDARYPVSVTAKPTLRAIPTDDRAWLYAALSDALQGAAPILPIPVEPTADASAALAALAHAELPDGTAVVVRTSGSSGIPKAVALSADALRASAEATHEAFGGPGQWLVTLPGHLVSGLQMLVRSAVSGIAPEFFDGRATGGFDPAALLDRAEHMDHERRYVSLVPVQFARLLDLAEADAGAAEALRGFDAVLVGGQHVSLELRRRAHDLGVALKRSYGMTETAGGCVYDGVEIGDTRVRIREGEVQLAGSVLALGYVGDPALTAERFVLERDTRWYRTGDAGHLLGGMLTVTGRLDRVIVSGGVNVSLDEIERITSEQPGWERAAAVGVADPEWGERPVLVREPGDEAIHLEFDGLRDLLRAQLGPAAVPERLLEVDELPRLTGGKIDRRAVEAIARSHP